jgi:hypothetical protein
MVLKLILGKQKFKVWTGLIWLKVEAMAGSCLHGNEPFGCIKCWKFMVVNGQLVASQKGLCSMEVVITGFKFD